MKETLHLIAELMNSDVRYVVDPDRIRPAKSEVFRLCGDNTKITTLTDWRPQVTLREADNRVAHEADKSRHMQIRHLQPLTAVVHNEIPGLIIPLIPTE